MLGTLNGALEVRQVSLPPDAISATVEGINEIVDGIPLLTRVDITYSLRIPAGTREVVERALSRHQTKCPTARSLEGSVAIEWTAHIEEQDPEAAGS